MRAGPYSSETLCRLFLASPSFWWWLLILGIPGLLAASLKLPLCLPMPLSLCISHLCVPSLSLSKDLFIGCMWAFFGCGEWGLLSSFHVRASHCSGLSCWEHGLQEEQASVVGVCWLSICLPGSRAHAQKLWHMGLVSPWHVRS